MKRINKILVLFLAVLVLFVTAEAKEIRAEEKEVIASGNSGKNVTWELYSDGYMIIRGEGACENESEMAPYAEQVKRVVVEEGITKIGDMYFADCSEMISIELPSSLKEIDPYAFSGCNKLANVNFSEGIEFIGKSAFSSCISLKEIDIPDTVNEIQFRAFFECKGLEKVVLPAGLRTVGYSLFNDCESLKEVIIPNGIPVISKSMFSNCESLLSVELPESITKIDGDAFYRCKSLINITMSENVTLIGNGAFAYCEKLRDFEFPKKLQEIESVAFAGCESLTHVKLPDLVKEISTNVFQDCKSLKSIHLPEDVVAISGGMLSGCTNLEVVEMSEEVNEIEGSAFEACNSLTDIYIYRKDCYIKDDQETIPKNIRIHAHSDSTAEEYANKYGNSFGELHYYGNWVVVEESTYEKEGIRKRTCKYCDVQQTDVMPVKKIKSLKINKTKLIMEKGLEDKLQVTWEPAVEAEIAWESSDEEIVVVNKYGKVSAVGVGEAVITATADGLKVSCKVTVNKKGKHTYKTSVTKKARMSAEGELTYICVSCGDKKTEVIPRIKSVKISTTKYIYNGKVRKPSITILNSYSKEIDPAYYTITYPKGRKNVGKYTIKIVFKGRYYGTYKRTFTIIPEETAIDDLSKNGTVIKVSWHERNRQITGYEIRYSTDSKYETYKTKRVSKKYLSTRIKELKKNKRYYLKIRTYKTVDDKRIYSLWSETRTIK